MLKIELTLKSQKSSLDALTLKEKIDIEILDKLINSDLLKKTFHNPHSAKFYCNERDQLLDYRNLIKDGFANVKYNKVSGIPFGRSNPDRALGLYSIRREIRHTLAINNYIDIDIENCHPVILLQICKANDIECDNLAEYVNNRDKYLSEIIKKFNVNRDSAKKLFIKLMYFGSFETWASDLNITEEAPKFIVKFKKEIQTIGNIIHSKNPEIVKLIQKRKDKQSIFAVYNIIGSTVSYYLQEIECRILESLYKYCISKKLIIDDAVLCADGLMIPKDNYNIKLLKEFTKLIKETYGLNLKFTTKDMDQGYLEILDDHVMANEIDLEQDFTIAKLTELFEKDIVDYEDKYISNFHNTSSFTYFNSYHAYFYFSNKIHKIYKNNINEYNNFDSSFDHLNFTIGKYKYKFTKLYNECKYKKMYSTFDFEPNKKTVNDKYNLFSGFMYDKPINFQQKLIAPFLDHVKYICSDNMDVYNYFISWMASIIQNPNIKTNVALVLYSITEGIGKNIVFDIFAKLLTGYTAKFRNTEGITDKFNGDLMGKLFVIGDEINGRAQDIMNELKDIITRLEENIEFKGKDKIKVNDYKNYAFTTNNENVFKISNTDRRFMFIECPEIKKSNDYYKTLFDIKDNELVLTHLHHYLNTFDISKFSTRDIVMTEYKKNIIISNIPAYIKFIKDEFVDYSGNKKFPLDLYKESLEYAKKNKMQSTYSEQLFYKQFKKIFGNYFTTSNKKNVYKFPSDIDEINKCIELHYLN
jgi:hypothetical protein